MQYINRVRQATLKRMVTYVNVWSLEKMAIPSLSFFPHFIENVSRFADSKCIRLYVQSTSLNFSSFSSQSVRKKHAKRSISPCFHYPIESPLTTYPLQRVEFVGECGHEEK